MDKLTLEALIDQLLGKPDNTDSHVYSDEPVIRRASEIKKPPVPAKIREMRRIAHTREAHWKTSAWLFYQQGTFMANYTDDYEYERFFTMFMPTYSDLDTEQLRGYFTWRTRFRKGELFPAPTPFLQLYAQEIINQIGISSAEEGFERLLQIQQEYMNYPSVLNKWISDYAIYYQLPEEYLNRCREFDSDKYLISIMNCAETDADSLYEAICALSGYNIGNSKFCKEYPLEYKEAIVRIIRSLSLFQEKHRKKSLCETLFGKKIEIFQKMFDYAVFYEKNKRPRFTVTVNSVRSYQLNGNTFCICNKFENVKSSKRLSLIAKETDRLLREAFNFKSKLKAQEIPKITLNLIENEINGIVSERERAATEKKTREIAIDISKLSKIRSDADIVRDRLIVEEEEDIFPEPAAEIYEEAPEETETETNICLLTAEENGFLQTLLSGSDIKAYSAGKGVLTSVLADGINEKLFDIFADNVIDFDGDCPVILEDYSDDVKKMYENGEL
ncbi:MAG: TerB N-terminal domain-containing protein [Alistipes sp.]|nr:TerB N-terminal domain-containing protein [Alistipes sp.]